MSMFLALALAAIIATSSSSFSGAVTAFSFHSSIMTVSPSSTNNNINNNGSWQRLTTRIMSSAANTAEKDTPVKLPDFPTKEEYLSYMESVSDLPSGFAVGTADGTFVPVEAPSM